MPKSKSLAFDLGPCSSGLLQTGNATRDLTTKLSRVIELDSNTGSVEVDTDALSAVVKSRLLKSAVKPFISALGDIASGGMAVFGTPDERSRKKAVAIPWIFISDLVFRLGGAPEGLRRDLGINEARTGGEAAALLRRNFPNAPEWMLKPAATNRFLRNPVALPGADAPGPRDPRDPEESPPRPDGRTVEYDPGGGFRIPVLDDAVDAARCLIEGAWGPLGGAWWGWAIGWQVCLNQDCADKISKLLMGLGGGSDLFKAVSTILKAESIPAGVAALTITAATVMLIYGFILGVTIAAVNSAKGACIQGNWPVIGGPGAFIWAVAGS